MSKKYLIVGGVSGGASAAAKLRRLGEEDQIILFEKRVRSPFDLSFPEKTRRS